MTGNKGINRRTFISAAGLAAGATLAGIWTRRGSVAAATPTPPGGTPFTTPPLQSANYQCAQTTGINSYLNYEGACSLQPCATSPPTCVD